MAAAGFYEYEDDGLTVSLPEYLRPKKGMRLFEATGRGKKGRQIFVLAVQVVEGGEYAETIRGTMRSACSRDWMGVEMRVIRQGPTGQFDDDFEFLITSTNTINGDIVQQYGLIFCASASYVHLTAGGRGAAAAFESALHEIAASIRLKALAGGQRSARLDSQPDAGSSPAPASSARATQQSAMRAGTHLTAKAQRRSKYAHSALVIPDELAGGVRLFLLANVGDGLIPGGSTWHENLAAAKAFALESLDIRESDWVEHQGEPEWVAAFREAAADAIKDAGGKPC